MTFTDGQSFDLYYIIKGAGLFWNDDDGIRYYFCYEDGGNYDKNKTPNIPCHHREFGFLQHAGSYWRNNKFLIKNSEMNNHVVSFTKDELRIKNLKDWGDVVVIESTY